MSALPPTGRRIVILFSPLKQKDSMWMTASKAAVTRAEVEFTPVAVVVYWATVKVSLVSTASVAASSTTSSKDSWRAAETSVKESNDSGVNSLRNL